MPFRHIGVAELMVILAIFGCLSSLLAVAVGVMVWLIARKPKE